MARLIIAHSSEWTDGTIGRMLKAFQAHAEVDKRRAWIEEQEQRLTAAKLNLCVIQDTAAEFDKRVIPTNRKEK